MSLFTAGFSLVRPFLHHMDAEQAHGLAIAALRCLPRAVPAEMPALRQNLWGLDFPNPLGLAPGFDKNAEVPDAALGLGFGFAEAGTVTPRPQAGNPKPRLFRLREDEAVINRMGFNNQGADDVAARLERRQGRGGIVGVNIGANKDATDRTADYVAGLKRFAPLASYITINISSPNTPGLRNLQTRESLRALLSALNDAREALARPVPLLLKIAPDLAQADLEDIAACCLEAKVDGVILTNTTLARPDLRSAAKAEQGGLSGRPLFDLSTRQLARFFVATEGQLPLIGVGGISDAETAFAKIEAGASLLQIYSALVFRGPALVHEIITGLTARLAGKPIGNHVGRRARVIAAGEQILKGRG